ncbi:MAG: hypothetical protein JSW39_18175 [Desulfobacterales bacterium]|nr:MAG: hypothetical protein JSW39_18175 [Desulfobacterales bacterium]
MKKMADQVVGVIPQTARTGKIGDGKIFMPKALLAVLFILFGMGLAWAGDEPPTPESNKTAIDLVQSHADYVWTLVAAALAFFMQAGFAMVEAGFTRAKNAINIMMKNLMDFSMGSAAFAAETRGQPAFNPLKQS